MARQRFLQVGFEIEGEKQLSVAFDYFGDALEDFSEPLEETNTILKRAWQKQFSSQGSELGTPWKRLSPKYGRWKAQNFPGKGILSKTGRMQKSFQSLTTKTETTHFNTAPYFPYHQSNASRSTNLPRRVMFKIDQTRRQKIFSAFTKFLNKVASHF
jgi:hypothetical protein